MNKELTTFELEWILWLIFLYEDTKVYINVIHKIHNCQDISGWPISIARMAQATVSKHQLQDLPMNEWKFTQDLNRKLHDAIWLK